MTPTSLLLVSLFATQSLAVTFSLHNSLPSVEPPKTNSALLADLDLTPQNSKDLPSIRFLKAVHPGRNLIPGDIESFLDVVVTFGSYGISGGDPELENRTLGIYANLEEDGNGHSKAGCILTIPRSLLGFMDGKNVALKQENSINSIVLWDQENDIPLIDPKSQMAPQCVPEPKALLPITASLPAPSLPRQDIANTEPIPITEPLDPVWLKDIMECNPPMSNKPSSDAGKTDESSPFTPTETDSTTTTSTPVETDPIMSILPILPYPEPTLMTGGVSLASRSSVERSEVAKRAIPKSSVKPTDRIGSNSNAPIRRRRTFVKARESMKVRDEDNFERW